MVDLLEKHRSLVERHARMMELGVNSVVVTNERLLSPTRAIGLPRRPAR